MLDKFVDDIYSDAKVFIAKHRNNGDSFESIKTLDVDETSFKSSYTFSEKFEILQDEFAVPLEMEESEWPELVSFVEKHQTEVSIVPQGLSNKGTMLYPVPTGSSSSWVQYKNLLSGNKTGKRQISDTSIANIEHSCHWLVNQLELDTRGKNRSIKGLVMGSVQSGKTANMIGLCSMAADYNWNLFIILSGSLENLRVQTRDRFKRDLQNSTGVIWHMLEQSKDGFVDLESGELLSPSELKLGAADNKKMLQRYVIVCLKNVSRLRNVIEYINTDETVAAKMRMLIIDDEADQAGINTKAMTDKNGNFLSEEEMERTKVNDCITKLVNGKYFDDSKTTPCQFQAINYAAFTATPYANILNESGEESLYPRDFIFSLPEALEYFGPKVIFGSKRENDRYPGLNIVRTISDEEVDNLKNMVKKPLSALPEKFKASIAWFLCSAAMLRITNYKKPISMLIHTAAAIDTHFDEKQLVEEWLKNKNDVLQECKNQYEYETKEFDKEALKKGFSDYPLIDSVWDEFLPFEQIEPEIELLLSEIKNIEIDENNNLSYSDEAIHLCVDNSKANWFADEGKILRVKYPDNQQLSKLEKAPVFIVIGGSTLARGLTLEGLICSYFARNTNQADTLLQMGRWFGYRSGVELLQRIYMPQSLYKKFEVIEKLDETLKSEINDYVERGKSPADYGPRILSGSEVKSFMPTAKNKSQFKEEADMNYSGDSYELTDFDDNVTVLSKNIETVDSFFKSMGSPEMSKHAKNAVVWRGIKYEDIELEFLDKFIVSDKSSLYKNLPTFKEWMKKINEKGYFRYWNVAAAGTQGKGWVIDTFEIGKVNRTKMKDLTYIDIGSLRSGTDSLCDVDPANLPEGGLDVWAQVKQNRVDFIKSRAKLGLDDIPLLLIYRIDKDGKTKSSRDPIDTDVDVVSFSIIVPGEKYGSNHVESYTIRMKVDF